MGPDTFSLDFDKEESKYFVIDGVGRNGTFTSLDRGGTSKQKDFTINSKDIISVTHAPDTPKIRLEFFKGRVHFGPKDRVTSEAFLRMSTSCKADELVEHLKRELLGSGKHFRTFSRYTQFFGRRRSPS